MTWYIMASRSAGSSWMCCDKMCCDISLFCRVSSLSWGSFAKETYYFKEPTSRSHRIESIPRVEWRGLPIGCGNLIQMKSLFWIFRYQSIWVRISGDNPSSRIFWRNDKFQDKMTYIKLRKTHALLRLENVVSPLHSTRGICIFPSHLDRYVWPT